MAPIPAAKAPVHRTIQLRQGGGHEAAAGPGQDARSFGTGTVRSAIKTAFILPAEIMAITLAGVPDASPWQQAAVLVHGGVALIVKADDVGPAPARNAAPLSSLAGLLRPVGADASPSRADRLLRPLAQGSSRALVIGMPVFLRVLAVIGTAAIVWVGGGIIIHGLEAYGLTTLQHAMHAVAEAACRAAPAMAAAAEWAPTATVPGIFGLLAGAMLPPLAEAVLVPAAGWLARHGRSFPRRS